MKLHRAVNRVCRIDDLVWDEWQYTVCEVRGFVYEPRPRKDAHNWVAEVGKTHKAWFLDSCLPVAWSAITCDWESEETAQGSKRPRR